MNEKTPKMKQTTSSAIRFGFLVDPANYKKVDVELITSDIPNSITVVNAFHRASFTNPPFISIELGYFVLQSLATGIIGEIGVVAAKSVWEKVKLRFIKVATNPRKDGTPTVGLTIFIEKPDGSKIDAKFTVNSKDPSVLQNFLDKAPAVAKEINEAISKTDLNFKNLYGRFDGHDSFEVNAQDTNDVYSYEKDEKIFIKDNKQR